MICFLRYNGQNKAQPKMIRRKRLSSFITLIRRGQAIKLYVAPNEAEESPGQSRRRADGNERKRLLEG